MAHRLIRLYIKMYGLMGLCIKTYEVMILCMKRYEVMRLCMKRYEVIRLCMKTYEVMRLCIKMYEVITLGMEKKRGFGGNAPNKLRPVLKARGVSLRATCAVGTAKSLYRVKSVADLIMGEKNI